MAVADGPDIRGFWAWFADRQYEILEIVSGRRPGRVTDLIDEALFENNIHLTYDVTESALGGELTFTPEGNPDLARFLDRFVAAAPAFDTWLIFNRRQRKSLDIALRLVHSVHAIDLSTTRFKVSFKAGRYHLGLLSDELYELSEADRMRVATIFLHYALGEELVTQCVGDLEFLPSGDGIGMGLLVNEIVCDTADLFPDEPLEVFVEP